MVRSRYWIALTIRDAARRKEAGHERRHEDQRTRSPAALGAGRKAPRRVVVLAGQVAAERHRTSCAAIVARARESADRMKGQLGRRNRDGGVLLGWWGRRHKAAAQGPRAGDQPP